MAVSVCEEREAHWPSSLAASSWSPSSQSEAAPNSAESLRMYST